MCTAISQQTKQTNQNSFHPSLVSVSASRWKGIFSLGVFCTLPTNTSSSTINLHTEIWQMVLDSRNIIFFKKKSSKSIIHSALFDHTLFHTWSLHLLKTSEICLKCADFLQPKYLYCSYTGLKPTQASSALGFSEKMVIYSPVGSYFCLGFLRLKYCLQELYSG